MSEESGSWWQHYTNPAVAESLEESSRAALAAAVEKGWNELTRMPDGKPVVEESFSKTSHDTYSDRRTRWEFLASLAVVCHHQKIEEIFTRWNVLQGQYAQHMRAEVERAAKGVKTALLQDEALLTELDTKRTEYQTAIAQASEKQTLDQVIALGGLAGELKELEDACAEVIGAQRIVEGKQRVIEDLTGVKKAPDRVSFVIPSKEELLELLKSNAYAGIPKNAIGLRQGLKVGGPKGVRRRSTFDPALVDIPESMNGYPPEIQTLLIMKYTFERVPAGIRFNAGDARKKYFKEDFSFGAKAMGGYMRKAPHLFGLVLESSSGDH